MRPDFFCHQPKPDMIIRILLFLLLGIPVVSQAATVRGIVLDAETGRPLPNVYVAIETLGLQSISNERGSFEMYNVPAGNYILKFELGKHIPVMLNINVGSTDLDLGNVQLVAQPDGTTAVLEDFIPTISISESDMDQLASNQNISGILTASRDVFVSAAAFTFGPARFRIRGLDSENTMVFLNGIPVNRLSNGRVFWNAWGGLNDVTRNRNADIGLNALPYTFGGIGGGTTIDTRALSQRAQTSVSYALSNRTFNHRIMATHSSGLLKNGWAFSVSGSRRWAQEAYIPGTYYDAWAYFLSVDKKLGNQHTLNFTAFDAPIKRGGTTASTQEMYDIAGSNYYNPLWGYQEGEKRNSRTIYSDQPMFIMRHDWEFKQGGTLTTAISYQFGENGRTRMDWFDAPDPRPDYYRNLPSFLRQDSDVAADFRLDDLTINENMRQLNWASFYDVNRNSELNSIFGAQLGLQNVEGRWSQYIIDDQRSDSRDANFYTNYQNVFSDKFTLNAGGGYQIQQLHEFKRIGDLLGGDYYVNIDQFALGEPDLPFNAVQNDLNNPSQILRQGDIWGYNYDMNIHHWNTWAQGTFTLRKFDVFLAGSASGTTFWRTGHYRNGRFPDDSFGDSEVQNFTNFGAKGGVTYKLNGRNYFYANTAYLTRAPFVDNTFVSPRTRDQLVPNLTEEKIFSAEAGYYLRSPNAKARATAYIAQFQDQVRILRFYNDLQRDFGNYVMSNLDSRNIGVELALDIKLLPSLNLTGVAAIGEYVYTSRAIGNTYLDNGRADNQLRENVTIYNKNYRVAGLPQQAYTVGLNYRSPNFWFANVNVNYFDHIYIDFNPLRRTADAVYGLDEVPEQFNAIIDQERVDPQFTVDFFGGKSFKFGKYFLFINVGVNNVLNNQSFITGGFEQLRFDVSERDPARYPTRYFYSFGTNFFANVSLRF